MRASPHSQVRKPPPTDHQLFSVPKGRSQKPPFGFYPETPGENSTKFKFSIAGNYSNLDKFSILV